MTKTPDFTKVMQDMMASMPVDTAAFQNAFKSHACLLYTSPSPRD